MSLSQRLSQLKTDAQKVTQWRQKYLPDPLDADRCFEFAVLFRLAADLAAVMGVQPVVQRRVKDAFAGAPANRADYNSLVVGGIELCFGVQFVGRSNMLHAPDIAVCASIHSAAPLAVVECKHYSGRSLPKPIAMAFVALLIDLHWQFFDGCGNRQMAKLLRVLPGSVPRIDAVCSLLRFCRSQLVTTVSRPKSLAHLTAHYNFDVTQEPRWLGP